MIDVFHNPEDRRPFVRRDRAATAFDAVAGPDEVCAFDVSYDTWVYPAYGRGWTRKVEFLKPAAGDVVIPDDVRWVLVDRSWNIFSVTRNSSTWARRNTSDAGGPPTTT